VNGCLILALRPFTSFVLNMLFIALLVLPHLMDFSSLLSSGGEAQESIAKAVSKKLNDMLK
jgi:hypothetical protein